MALKVKIWTPKFEEIQKLFASEYSLKILVIIYQMSRQGRQLCAADVAKLLNIHVTTAKKNLELLSEYEFLEKEEFPHRPGKPTYFQMKKSEITITLNMETLIENIDQTDNISELPNPSIRENPNLPPRVTYNINNDGLVKEIIVKSRTKGRKTIKRKIVLKKDETNLMKYLPHPTMDSKSFQDILKEANIIDYYNAKMLFEFVKKLMKYDIVEVIES